MFSNGRMVAVALVSLGFGFVGGAWFIGSGLGFALIPLPTVPPDYATPAAPTPKRVTPTPVPRVKAMEVPSPAKFDVHLLGLEPRADRNDLIPAPGCDWVIDPRRYTSSNRWIATTEEWGLWGCPAVHPSTGGLLYILVQFTGRGNAAIQLRPVFFDQIGTRYLPLRLTNTAGGFGGQFFAREFTLAPLELLPRDKIAYFGIERIGPDADRLLAEAAHKAAKEQGVAILPRPEVGRPYRFDLITADGQRIRTEDFRGKAIVVWAWGPSLLNHWLHFDLKRIRDRYIDNELAFVGVSFDDSVEEARTTFAQSKTDGSLVVVPNEPKIRRLWHDGAQITRLPTYFLIDRDGNLQDIGYFFQLKNNVDIRLGRWKPFLSDRPKFGPPRLPPRPGSIAPPSQPAAPKK